MANRSVKQQKAEKQIQKILQQPGHKKEKKTYNNARRGNRIKNGTVIETAVIKRRKRSSVKEQTRKEIQEEN